MDKHILLQYFFSSYLDLVIQCNFSSLLFHPAKTATVVFFTGSGVKVHTTTPLIFVLITDSWVCPMLKMLGIRSCCSACSLFLFDLEYSQLFMNRNSWLASTWTFQLMFSRTWNTLVQFLSLSVSTLFRSWFFIPPPPPSTKTSKSCFF